MKKKQAVLANSIPKPKVVIPPAALCDVEFHIVVWSWANMIAHHKL